MKRGAILKNKRIECGLLQEDVAEKMGISQRTISSWETGRTVPKLDDYDKLAQIFGCSINELTGRDNYDVSSISARDIMIKLPDLDTVALIEICERSQKLIEEKKRIEQMQSEILDYKRRIEELEREIHESKKD